MCGINGFNFSDKELIKKMMAFTKNRGPDANGIYSENEVTISHDRLSIIDLTSKANQPMNYKNYIISFNGEIYNYKNLKKELEETGEILKLIPILRLYYVYLINLELSLLKDYLGFLLCAYGIN